MKSNKFITLNKRLIYIFFITYILIISNAYSKELTNNYVESQNACEFLKDIDKNYNHIANNYQWLNGTDSCVSNLFDKILEKYKDSKDPKYLILIDSICANANEGISEGFGFSLHPFFFDNFDYLSDYLFQKNILLKSRKNNILTLVTGEEIILMDNQKKSHINKRLKNIKTFFKLHFKNMPKEKKVYLKK